MTDNFELNQLLDKAKQAQQAWDEWESEEDCVWLPSWKDLTVLAQESWRLLYKAVIKAEPVALTLESGETCQVYTVGALTADQMLYFSPDANAKTTTQGANLRFACKIEKI